MSCDCINEIDESLRERGLQLTTPIILSKELGVQAPRTLVQVEWIKTSRKPRPNLFATYCPFCGVRYVQEPTAAEPAAVMDTAWPDGLESGGGS